jgi:hypothetical protein
LESAEVAEEKGDGEELFKRTKRKRGKEERGLKGLKIRRESSGADAGSARSAQAEKTNTPVTEVEKKPESELKLITKPSATGSKPAATKGSLGLVDYGSSDDD